VQELTCGAVMGDIILPEKPREILQSKGAAAKDVVEGVGVDVG